MGPAITVNKLFILSVLQLGMSGAILYVVMDSGSELHVQESERYSSGRAETVTEARSDGGPTTVDAELIRQIVRSELIQFSAQKSDPASAPAADASVPEPHERDILISEAKDRIALYLSVGEISDWEIEQFQSDISALDTATQSAMLSELFRQINAGTVKVRQ